MKPLFKTFPPFLVLTIEIGLSFLIYDLHKKVALNQQINQQHIKF